ncbi:DNA cytosine methyltransferase [Deinococcus sp. VB343]|uniref:DNA cytosine methyltransferase n=1 Tax=Deinococcus sp. VB343 TaxID=3385567 RepID=UPI0039C9B255
MRTLDNAEFRAVDFFSGVGGFSLSAARAGFLVTDAFEIDKFATRSHKMNFPKCNTHSVDLTNTTNDEILTMLNLKEGGGISLVIGGPPCQGFSDIGNNIENDPRNDLFTRFFDIINSIKPTFFVAENVPGILKEKNIKYIEHAYSKVQADYVTLKPITLKASDLGAPTSRTRIFFVGVRRDANISISEDDFLFSQRDRITVEEALLGLPRDVSELKDGIARANYVENSFHDHLRFDIPDGVGDIEAINNLKVEGIVTGMLPTNHSPKVKRRYGLLKQGERDGISKAVRLKSDGFCPTLRAGTDHTRGSYQAVRPIHPFEDRVITPREAARLQGFPDWFIFDRTIWHSFRQIGNSVSPIVGTEVLKVLHRKLEAAHG